MAPIEGSADRAGAAAATINAARNVGRTMLFRMEMKIPGFTNDDIIQENSGSKPRE